MASKWDSSSSQSAKDCFPHQAKKTCLSSDLSLISAHPLKIIIRNRLTVIQCSISVEEEVTKFLLFRGPRKNPDAASFLDGSEAKSRCLSMNLSGYEASILYTFFCVCVCCMISARTVSLTSSRFKSIRDA